MSKTESHRNKPVSDSIDIWPLETDVTELLNTFTYDSYGQISNSNCCDLSNANRLAVATDRCILILNFNFDWPSFIKNSLPNKFLNNPFLSNNMGKPGAKFQTNQFELWIQDLTETRNESIYINTIRPIAKSQLILNVYKHFFSIDENVNNKRKSFTRLIRDVVKSKKLSESQDDDDDDDETNESTGQYSHKRSNNHAKCKKIDENYVTKEEILKSDEREKLIMSNREQYQINKTYFEQSKFFDWYYFEYLSYLNPTMTHNLNKNQEATSTNSSAAFEGFRMIKWNSSINCHLLAVITVYNELIIFDCTNIKSESQSNLIQTSMNQVDDEMLKSDFTKIFDIKTKSKSINLTELWLTKHQPHLIHAKPKTLNEFATNLNKITPVSLNWSTIINIEKADYEILFVAFKSNVIAAFLVHHSSDHLNIDLVSSFDISNYKNNEIDDSEDECININPVLFESNLTTFHITSLSFLINNEATNGLLAIGMSNGDVLINKIELNKDKFPNTKNFNWNFNPLKIANSSIGKLGSIEQLQLIALNESFESFLVIVQKENRIAFVTIEVNENSITQNDHLFYRCQESNFFKQIPECKNYLTKIYLKLIDFKLIKPKFNTANDFEFLLSYENSFIEYLRLNVNTKNNYKLNLTKACLINESTDVMFIKENQLFNSEASEHPTKQFNFKTTKKFFISSNDMILFQIKDFSKSILIQKRPPQFQISLYRINSTKSFIQNYFQQSISTNIDNEQELIKFNDFIWLFKCLFYLNNDSFYNESTFNQFYSNLKQYKELSINDQISNKNELLILLSRLKRMRVLCLFIGNYYQTASSFENLNVKKANEEEEDEDEDDEDDDMLEEDEEEQMDEVDDCKVPNKNVVNSNSIIQSGIIKSSSFYMSSFKELTINIYKYHALSIVSTAYLIGFEKLTNNERLLLLIIGEFSINKNFFANFKSNMFANSKETFNGKQIEIWLKEKFLNLNLENNCKESKSLKELVDSLTCDICPQKLKISNSNDLTKISCVGGHTLNRCQKSLLPLNYINFNRCSMCGSTWNLFDTNEYPHLTQLNFNQNFCLFCD